MISAARPDELAPALRLLVRHSAEGDRQVAAALELIRRGELDPAGVLVARGADGIEGVIACAALPGAGALVWPPQTRHDSPQPAIEDHLLRQALSWLRDKGTKLAQAILPLDDVGTAVSLTRHGFTHVTTLEYLRHDLDIPLALLGRVEELQYECYDPASPQRFQETLLRTYEGSCDFPEVNGVRGVDEILAGHRGQGVHDPQLWWLGKRGGVPVGVLLLTELSDGDGWDVAYLGVVPEARRSGIGRELIGKALVEARAAEQPQLTLSVDQRNRPACRLYQSVGFDNYAQRAVFLKIW